MAEDQRVLGGPSIAISPAVDDDQWETRAALDAYLRGRERSEFETEARDAVELWMWEHPQQQARTIDAFMRRYDDVVRAPDRFIARFGVRYVALAADDARTESLREGWTVLQRGPYWQVWERSKSAS